MRSFLFLILLVVAGAIGLGAWWALLPSDPTAIPTRIEILKGDRATKVSRTLSELGIVRNPSALVWLGRLTGDWKHLKTGEYEVSGAQSPLQVLRTLSSGIPIQYPFLVTEGENRYEVATHAASKGLGEKQRFLELSEDPRFIATLGLGAVPPETLEGYLFPDTYLFPKRVTEEEVLRAMVKRFLVAWTPAREKKAEARGLSRQETLILASIVEKETGAPEERPQISSVFQNRLKKGMRLQSDPTTIYGIWARYDGNIRKSDLQEKTPWNTYAISGLPKGPISNPGIEAIDAVLAPADTSSLFFVSKNDGTHVFTETYEDHQRAVKTFQLDPHAREGKSWRDLKKRAEPKR